MMVAEIGLRKWLTARSAGQLFLPTAPVGAAGRFLPPRWRAAIGASRPLPRATPRAPPSTDEAARVEEEADEEG